MPRAIKRNQRELVLITRKGIDSKQIQGFVLGSSERLVLLQYVHDFHLDGLLVLNKSDITEIRCSATDKFQRGLLRREGLLERVPFEAPFNLSDWRSIIRQLAKAYLLIILECERGEDPDFVIGRVAKTTSAAVYVRYFTGAGRWLERLVRVKYSDITSCQVGTNYLNVYQRHFERVQP
jgi:hypothetical protein